MIHETPEWMLWGMIAIASLLMLLPAFKPALPSTISLKLNRRELLIWGLVLGVVLLSLNLFS
jgi:hypothetical protein